jgi:hypothetical protein
VFIRGCVLLARFSRDAPYFIEIIFLRVDIEEFPYSNLIPGGLSYLKKGFCKIEVRHIFRKKKYHLFNFSF